MADSLSFSISSSSIMKFALPTILSTIFMNIYSLVDSFFASNLVGTDALSAVNIALSFHAVALAVGTMITTGGNALVGKELGEGRNRKAKENFSFFLLFCPLASVLFSVAEISFRRTLLYAMGSNDALSTLAEAYTVPLFIAVPAVMCSILIEIILVTSGMPSCHSRFACRRCDKHSSGLAPDCRIRIRSRRCGMGHGSRVHPPEHHRSMLFLIR